MNIPEKLNYKISRNQIIIYTAIISFCIISIIVASYVQFYARIDFAEMIGIKKKEEYASKTEEQIELIKSEFDNIFKNSIQNDNGSNDNKKEYKDRSLVCTKYEKQDTKTNGYEININIPYINIDNEIIRKYNEEIENIFASKARSVLNSENKNIIYTVEYTASVEDDILSLIIRSNLKEGTSAQRVIIQTYNYDLRNNKEISLSEILKIEQLDKQEIQDKINNTIQEEEKKVEDLRKLGYNIFNRDITSDMYYIENSREFYYTADALYIIYAYGNDSYTSEMDLIII